MEEGEEFRVEVEEGGLLGNLRHRRQDFEVEILVGLRLFLR